MQGGSEAGRHAHAGEGDEILIGAGGRVNLHARTGQGQVRANRDGDRADGDIEAANGEGLRRAEGIGEVDLHSEVKVTGDVHQARARHAGGEAGRSRTDAHSGRERAVGFELELAQANRG